MTHAPVLLILNRFDDDYARYAAYLEDVDVRLWLVSTKVEGFKQSYDDFQKLKVTPSAAYFTYRDGNNHLRYNYFQWFAVPGSSAATLEMSVAGRKRDVPGLKALFDRFADNAIGTVASPPDKQRKNDNNG